MDTLKFVSNVILLYINVLYSNNLLSYFWHIVYCSAESAVGELPAASLWQPVYLFNKVHCHVQDKISSFSLVVGKKSV